MASAPGSRRRLYALLALLGCVLLVPAPAQEKKLSIYGPHVSYSLVVNERDGKDYVALADVLQPLGAIDAKMVDEKLKVSFTPAGAAKSVDLQFTAGQNRAKVRGADMELASRFLAEGDRGMVPVRSLPLLLARTCDTPVQFHAAARRLFIGNPGVRYSAELKKAPTRVVLSFSAPVNPSIATEPGGLRMLFTRDALVGNGQSQELDDDAITRINFNEANGVAELAVAANVPLVPKFSDSGRIITITAATTSAPPATAAAQLPALPTLPQPQASVPQGPKFLVIIDPGHGGAETGAALGDVAEKDFNLMLARRLRAELEGRGINATLVRDADTALSLEQRALSANAAHAAVYIAIHASSIGTGVRIYTSDLSPGGSHHEFLPFDRVQAAHLDGTSLLTRAIIAELARRQVGAASLPAPVRPLNNIATAAVALEVAPPPNDLQGLVSPAYQQSICSALGAALAVARPRLEHQR